MRPEQPWVQPDARKRAAYWRVVILRSGPRKGQLINKNSRQAVCRWPLGSHQRPGGSARSIRTDRPSSFLLLDLCAIHRPAAAASSTLMATTSQPQSLLSIARLNVARSRAVSLRLRDRHDLLDDSAPSPTGWKRHGNACLPLLACRRANGAVRTTNVIERLLEEFRSRLKPFCHPPTPPRCCSGL